MTEGILRLPHGQLRELIQQGKMEVVTAIPNVFPTPEIRPSSDRMAERAKDILGKDFLGVEAITTLEKRLGMVGVDVSFNLDTVPPLDCNEGDLQFAKQNNEMLVLRAEKMRMQLTKAVTMPITLLNFRELFRKDPNKDLQTVFYSFRKDANDWYKNEAFATEMGGVKLGWAFVKKEPLDDSFDKTWKEQEEMLKKYAKTLNQTPLKRTNVQRRTALEATWDNLLYYINNKEQLLPDKYDWTKSGSSRGNLVRVGVFDSDGLLVGHWNPEYGNPYIGVCPSR
jgi:hypothetical protein